MTLRDLFQQAPSGALTLRELRPYVSRGRLAELVGAGQLVYEGRGTYRMRTSPPDRAIAKQLRGVLSHRSAADRHRLPLTEAVTTTELTVSPRRSRVNPPEGVHVYYRRIGPEDTDGVATSVVRTILDCARDLPVPEALAPADAAVRTGKVSLTELTDAAGRLRGPGSAHVRRLIGWIDPRAVSVLESAARGVLLDGGVTGFQPQFPVKISTGQIFHADLGHERARLLVEAESLMSHTGPVMERDAMRYSEFAASGYTVMRFTWSNVMFRRPWVAGLVRSALEQRGISS